MENSYVKSLLSEENKTTTTNGDVAFKDTNSALLNMYSIMGSIRSVATSEKIKLFDLAYAEDSLNAFKLLFMLRDVRGGMGERSSFRELLVHAANTYPNELRKNINLISHYGRWDDLFVLFETELKTDALSLICTQLTEDLKAKENEPISLLVKWLPSENTSSIKTVAMAKFIAKSLELTPKRYRKVLTTLRKKLSVVEVKMSSNSWDTIEYQHVCSRSHMIYGKAFNRHDHDRFSKYKEDLVNGKATINSSGINPYELVYKARTNQGDEAILQAQWESLPTYLENTNALAVCDVSGSMCCNISKTTKAQAIDVSVGMSIYMASKNTGAFKDLLFTFSKRPEIINLANEKTLKQRYNKVLHSDWGMDTNIEALYDKVLQIAVNNNVPASDMVESLFIFSDMQFNSCVENSGISTYQNAKAKFEKAGYKIPRVIFWNLRGSLNNHPVTKDDENTVLISGFSAELFKYVMSGDTPYESMIEALNDIRYSCIKV